MSFATSGAALLCATFDRLGVKHVFGVPGTQNVLLYEALGDSPIRSILCTHELAAGFMANGYYRASGRIAPVVTIPGPGFTYALTPLAEARQDSAALLLLVNRPAERTDRRFGFQALNQAGIAAMIAKGILQVDVVDEIPRVVAEAHHLCLSGEPGPVLLEWSGRALADRPSRSLDPPTASRAGPPPAEPPVDEPLVAEAAALLCAARRPVLMVGQGAAAAASLVRRLAESISAPVFTTVSGRGILPEDHVLALGFDFTRGDARVLNELVGTSDCVLAVGCKLSQVGTAHFGLDLPPDRLIRVDASSEVLEADYPCRLAILGSAEAAMQLFVSAVENGDATVRSAWTSGEIAHWKRRVKAIGRAAFLEPVINGVTPRTAQSFCQALRRALPREGIMVTDAGLHQLLVRRHYEVLAPRGLITPTDFGSMGFGLPAAIGAKLAAPERPVVAVIGDGGFAASGMELLTAVRERVPLTLIVFNDGRLNIVRLQQFAASGRSQDVDILTPDLEAFSASVGARYACIDGNAEEVLRVAIAGTEVTLVEVLVGDSIAMRALRGKGVVRRVALGVLRQGMPGRAGTRRGVRCRLGRPRP